MIDKTAGVDIDRYVINIVGPGSIDIFFTFNGGMVWFMAEYFFFSGLDKSDLIKRRKLSYASPMLMMMCGYFFAQFIFEYR